MLGILVAAAVSLLFALVVTPVFDRVVSRMQWGQQIRVDGPVTHQTKRGTPSMGGAVIIVGSVIGYFAAALASRRVPAPSALLVLLLLVGLGAVGFIDDWLKARKKQSLGLTGWAKIGGQVVVAILFAVLALRTPPRNGITAVSETISGFRDTSWDWDLSTRFGVGVAAVVFTVWISLIVIGSSNAVNIADGLDGLASGAALLSFASYLAITFWQYEEACRASNIRLENVYKCYTVRDPLDLAIVAAAIIGGLVGFLWCGTRLRPASSWVIPAHSASGAHSRDWRSSAAPNCCCCRSGGCSSS
jgi:phospho-N-acetylmuramoyl-pentapeptide-transferase